jgi:uncharacterized protein YcnI
MNTWTRVMVAAAALLGGTAASAHVVLEQKSAPAGSMYKGTFMVGHGCAGSPTVAITVFLPEGVLGARPMAKPGWAIETVRETLATPVETHGRRITDRVATVTWRGGPLPDASYDEFVLMMQLPTTPGVRYFRVLQNCDKGEHDWAQIPGPGQSRRDLKQPAAVLDILPAP